MSWSRASDTGNQVAGVKSVRTNLLRVEQEDGYEQMEIAKVGESYIIMKRNKSPVK